VSGHDLLTGQDVIGPLRLAAGGCGVLRQEV
jgi:hypothetical protein